MAVNHSALDYIIRFLLGDDISTQWAASIGYTADRNSFDRYRIVIIPSGFFDKETYGTPASMPSLPLHEIEGIPLLFGDPKIEKVGDTLVTHADLIASSYFLISRYEEMMRRNYRDEHGRFPGHDSLSYKGGFIHRPIIDEYRLLLRRWLKEIDRKIPDIPKGIRKINLTHDVDAPFLYRSWKGMVRHFRDHRKLFGALRAKFGSVKNDPYYTFPFLFEQDRLLVDALGPKKVDILYFIKAGGDRPQDKPHYNPHRGDVRKLIDKIKKEQATIGLHSSYQAGEEPSLIRKELDSLKQLAPITCNRHHFLACREPEDMEALAACGITDDYTMGYADIAGFRLGTSFPVRAINPVTQKLSSLVLQPLTIMDCSLNTPQYMNLSEEEALIYCLELFEQVSMVGGDISLLWHNTSFMEQPGNYLKKLYVLLINELMRK